MVRPSTRTPIHHSQHLNIKPNLHRHLPLHLSFLAIFMSSYFQFLHSFTFPTSLHPFITSFLSPFLPIRYNNLRPPSSSLLWPPPCWIWSIDRVKRIEIVETAINEILDRIPENFKAEAKRDRDPCDYFGKPVVLEFTRDIFTLSKLVISFQEEETEFMNKLQETTDMLNKGDKFFELARTIPWAAEGRLGLHEAFKEVQACHSRVLRSTLRILRSRYAHLLYIEERATQLEMFMNSHIARILTK